MSNGGKITEKKMTGYTYQVSVGGAEQQGFWGIGIKIGTGVTFSVWQLENLSKRSSIRNGLKWTSW